MTLDSPFDTARIYGMKVASAEATNNLAKAAHWRSGFRELLNQHPEWREAALAGFWLGLRSELPTTEK